MKLLITFIVCFMLTSSVYAKTDEDYDDYKYSYRINDDCNEVYDPYEQLNRKIFAFNSFLDYLILRPVAVGYKNLTNSYVKARVNSFLRNINEPLSMVNYAIQLNLNNSLKSFWRFTINTTFGIGGLFDVASKVNLTVTTQTFSNTLAHYGIAPGPYLVLPFIGSTNARDLGDTVSNNMLNPIRYKTHKDFQYTVTSVRIISSRAAILPFTDFIAKDSTDPYSAVRSAFHQNRESTMVYPKGFKCPKLKKEAK